MMRFFALLLLPLPAAAHDGPHLHPHGVEGLWVLAAVALGAGVAGWALVRLRGRQ